MTIPHFSRVTLTSVLIVSFCLALAGCAPRTTSSTPTTELTGAEKDRMYSTLVKAQEDNVPSGADLPAAGRAICEGLSQGADVQDIDDVIEKQGNSHEYALALISPAPGTYCPQYSSKVAAWLAIQ